MRHCELPHLPGLDEGRRDELAAGPPGPDDLPLRPRGVRHGIHFRAGEQGDRGGQRLRRYSGRLHPRPLAAAEQLGSWADFFTQAGYAPLTPDWPDDPETVDQARANPDVLAGKTLNTVAGHTADVIGRLKKKPAVIGHAFGGPLAQMSPARGRRQPPSPRPGRVPGGPAAAVVHAQGKSAFPVLDTRHRGRAMPLTFEPVQLRLANALDEDEAKALYKEFPWPGDRVCRLAQMGNANLNPGTEDEGRQRTPSGARC